MSKRQQDNQTRSGEPRAATRKRKKKLTNIDRIAEVNRRALAMNMSYGKYVAKFGDEIETEE